MTKANCILVAEDDDNDAFFIEHAFRAADLQQPLQRVRDGQETIDYLSGVGAFADRDSHPLPSLLLLDLQMPGKTGWDVLHWLRHQSPLQRLPVIIFSSSAQRGDIDRAYEMGANSFIVKPSSTHDRVELAKSIKVVWLQFNEPPSACVKGRASLALPNSSNMQPGI